MNGAEICGGTYDLTVTYNGVIHTTEFPDGRTEMNATFAGELLAESNGGDGPSYTGRSASTFDLGFNDSPFTSTVFIVAKGSDGSMLRFFYLVHTNSTPSGMEVEFEKAQCG